MATGDNDATATLHYSTLVMDGHVATAAAERFLCSHLAATHSKRFDSSMNDNFKCRIVISAVKRLFFQNI